MAIFKQEGKMLSFDAAEDIAMGLFVALDTDGNAIIPSSGTYPDDVVGVAIAGEYTASGTEDTFASGDKVTVITTGVVTLAAGAGIDEGDWVKAGAAGEAQKVGAGHANTTISGAIARV